ncbi:MAG: GDSL-type esterase/lipase family protein [Acidobacteriota bacterium]
MSISPRLRSLAANLGLATVSVLVFLLVVEAALRLTGFSFVLYPEDIEFGRPDPVTLKAGFLEDDDLFWVKKEYPEMLDRLRGERPRLILLGDSCTHLGGWDRALADLAASRHAAPLTWGNLAVAGWSSFQGRRQLERDVSELAPAVVTLYFGWNDHWIGFGLEDRTIAEVKRIFSKRWSSIRLVQLATRTTVAWRARGSGYPNRVSLDDFADNLRAMVEQTRGFGGVPVIFTAPSNHVEGAEPARLADRFLRDLNDLVPMHRAYVEAARQVAAETRAPLCDLAAELDALPTTARDRLFMADGIHFTPAGDRVVADRIYDCLDAAELWPRLLDDDIRTP